MWIFWTIKQTVIWGQLSGRFHGQPQGPPLGWAPGASWQCPCLPWAVGVGPGLPLAPDTKKVLVKMTLAQNWLPPQSQLP